MLNTSNFHEYQTRAIEHGLTHKASSLWLFLGAGKTISALTVIIERMDRLQVSSVLILAPLRVAQAVWEQEAKKWEHTKDLTFSLIHGNADRRKKAVLMPSDIYLINYENLVWLKDFIATHEGSRFNCQMLVMDEISKLKNAQTKRHKALMKIISGFEYRIGLTATPASNGYKDLFGQYLALDNGQRLGAKLSHFKNKFFTPTGYMNYDIKLKTGARESIQEAISDITLEMSAKEYSHLPPVTFNDIYIDLPVAARSKYEQMERDLFMQLDSGDTIEIANMAALSNKCLQVANGAAYINPGEPEFTTIHDAKLDALEDIIEEAGHNPVLVLNQFQHDRIRILKKFPQSVWLKGGMSIKRLNDTINAWNRGEIEILVGHAASMGHGLNLQGANNAMIVWFGLPWALELYLQANARIDRQGVKHHVIINRILASNTVDLAVKIALLAKANTESDLRNAVAQYRRLKFNK